MAIVPRGNKTVYGEMAMFGSKARRGEARVPLPPRIHRPTLSP